MPKSGFQFRDFYVAHEDAAMKVGTDGVLLGAWSDVRASNRILDIGTGSGLIALMCASRSSARIYAIDVSRDAIIQAEKNFADSKWHERLQALHVDVRDFEDTTGGYDTIICNPPFYTENVLSEDVQRRIARSASLLSFEQLISSVKRLILAHGTFYVVIPYTALPDFLFLCEMNRLYLATMCKVHSVSGFPISRVLLKFINNSFMPTQHIHIDNLSIADKDGAYTAEYKILVKDFMIGI